jgi:hypothetical protein
MRWAACLYTREVRPLKCCLLTDGSLKREFYGMGFSEMWFETAIGSVRGKRLPELTLATRPTIGFCPIVHFSR